MLIVGGRMLWGIVSTSTWPRQRDRYYKGLLLLTLSIATSIDALAIGLSFAFLKISIAIASAIIGVVAFWVTVIGFVVGKRASKITGKRAETLGGIILVAIAFCILLSHILVGQ